MRTDRPIKILAIESSCDETAAAVICGANEITNNQDTNPKQIPNPDSQTESHSELAEESYNRPVSSTGVNSSESTDGEKALSNLTIKQFNNNFPVILSSVISSQIDLHAKTGGVVPEVASRAHLESIIPVITEALVSSNDELRMTPSSRAPLGNNEKSAKPQVAKTDSSNNADLGIYSDLDIRISDLLKDVTHIAVTVGPGLIGSLLVGFNTAKALSYALDIPIVPINHIEGHVYSALAQNKVESRKLKVESGAKPETCNLKPENFPLLALTVSGGHTSLTLMHDHGKYENIGATMDDAAGEAFDKVAKLLDLGYPGGPAVSRVAKEFRENGKRTGLSLPLPLANDPSFNFSFSGLKTSVLYAFRKAETDTAVDLDEFRKEMAAVFEETAVAHLISKTLKAQEKYQASKVMLAGGVAANSHLRESLASELARRGIELIMPPLELTGDNAVMIGVAAYYHVLRGDVKRWDEINVDSNLKL